MRPPPPRPGPYAFVLDSVACTMQSFFVFCCFVFFGPLSCEMGHSTDDGAKKFKYHFSLNNWLETLHFFLRGPFKEA